MTSESGTGICVFSPGLRLTVTAEVGPHGEEIHLHPGGQGYWLARSIERLGEPEIAGSDPFSSPRESYTTTPPLTGAGRP